MSCPAWSTKLHPTSFYVWLNIFCIRKVPSTHPISPHSWSCPRDLLGPDITLNYDPHRYQIYMSRLVYPQIWCPITITVYHHFCHENSNFGKILPQTNPKPDVFLFSWLLFHIFIPISDVPPLQNGHILLKILNCPRWRPCSLPSEPSPARDPASSVTRWRMALWWTGHPASFECCKPCVSSMCPGCWGNQTLKFHEIGP